MRLSGGSCPSWIDEETATLSFEELGLDGNNTGEVPLRDILSAILTTPMLTARFMSAFMSAPTGGDYSTPGEGFKPPIQLQDFLSAVLPTSMLASRLRSKRVPVPTRGPQPSPGPNALLAPTPGSMLALIVEVKQVSAQALWAVPGGLNKALVLTFALTPMSSQTGIRT